LPTSITIPASVVLSVNPGGSLNVANSYTWIFSTDCGGTFSSTTLPNNGPANPMTIGPTTTTPVQVTYHSTGAAPGACTFSVQLSGGGNTATLTASVTILSGGASHIYWTNSATSAIGRANLDGTAVNQSFISGASSPIGVAVGP
jgi:hypothetical protein